MKRAAWIGLVILSVARVAHAQSGQPPQRGDDPAGALRYFMMLRANPDGRIPFGARNAALSELRRRWPQALARRDALLTATPNSSNSVSWQPLGPMPINNSSGRPWAGRLNSIAVDPSNNQRIFIGAAQGGVWRSTDGGVNWTPLTDSACSLAMGSVVIDPADANVIYAGTGEQNNSGDSYYGCGVLRSTDGGDHWNQLGQSSFVSGTNTSARIARIVVDRTNSSNLLVAASTGLWRSTDAGATWTAMIRNTVTAQPDVASDVIQDTANPNVFYAAQGNRLGSGINGVWKSTDGGATWAILTGFPSTNVGRINLAVTNAGGSASAGVVYAAVQNISNSSLLGIYVTTDGGTTWSARNPGGVNSGTAMCSGQCWYSMVIAADPVTPGLIYFGGLSLYKSIDGGSNFTDIGFSIHVDQHGFAFGSSPSTIYAGNDGGIFTSADAGTTWTSLNSKLAITQFYAGVSVSPTSATTVLGGTQDNGTLQWSGTSDWPQVLSGDGGFSAIDQITGATAFGETQWTANSNVSQFFSGPRRRDAGSSQFNQKITGINSSDAAAFIPPLVIDPFRPNVLFFGTKNLYRTSNSGDQWVTIGASLVATSGVITAIGVAPSDSNTVYVGSSDFRVAYTHDLGGKWTTANGLTNAPVTDFAVDPRDARTAIITFGAFTGSHVFKTTDGGVSWTNLTFDLPNTPVLAVVLEPGSGDIDIGTDIGVFTLRNGTQSWAPVMTGLPNVAVYDLVFDAPRSRLIAATHGRGMFSLDVTVTALRGDVTGDGTVGVADAQAILDMLVGKAPPAGSTRYPNADANCDGQITALDALVVLMKAANINTGTCVGTIH